MSAESVGSRQTETYEQTAPNPLAAKAVPTRLSIAIAPVATEERMFRDVFASRFTCPRGFPRTACEGSGQTRTDYDVKQKDRER